MATLHVHTGPLATAVLESNHSSKSLATINSQDTEEDSLSLSSRATLMSSVSARSTLRTQTRLPLVSRSHTNMTKTNINSDPEATEVLGRLRAVCTTDSNASYEQADPDYKTLEPSTQEPKEMYDTVDPATKDIVIRDGEVYRSLVSLTNNGTSTEYTRPHSVNTQLRNQIQRRDLESGGRSPTYSARSSMYTVPEHTGPSNYQGLQPEPRALYTTPYTQWDSGGEMDVAGHMYQLPNSSSMEPLSVYNTPDSRNASVDY